MSHFSVAVIVEHPHSVDAVLEPYGAENEEWFERIPYMNKAQYIDQYRRYHGDTDLSDEDIWQIAHNEYIDVDDEEGMIYENYNPDAQWDWYEIGGRWEGSLIVPKHVDCVNLRSRGIRKAQRGKTRKVNGAQIKDILWGLVNKANCAQFKKLSSEWDETMQRPADDWHRRRAILNYDTKESFIMLNSLFTTHAFVVQGDDVWNDRDGMLYKDYMEAFYNIIHDPHYQDWWIVIVDCHM